MKVELSGTHGQNHTHAGARSETHGQDHTHANVHGNNSHHNATHGTTEPHVSSGEYPST